MHESASERVHRIEEAGPDGSEGEVHTSDGFRSPDVAYYSAKADDDLNDLKVGTSIIIKTITIVGRGRTASLLSGPGSKKRKIGPNKYESREGFQRDQIEGLQQEVEALRRNLIDANAQIHLRQHNSASTVQLSQFQI